MKHVPEPHRLRNSLMTIGAVVCLVVVAAALIKVPETVSGSCLIDPGRQWEMTEMRPGSYKTVTNDLVAGELRNYRVYQFGRPSFVDLSLAAITAGDGQATRVSAGDLLATANSTTLTIQFIEKETELAQARSELDVLKAGAKPAVILQAELAIKMAQAELATYEIQYDRQKKLFEEEILSSEDWELFVSQMDLRKLDVELAQATLDQMTTGESTEIIEQAVINVASLERELAASQEMIDALEIRTPIDGTLSLNEKATSLLTVADNDTMVARILLPQKQAQKPEVGNPIRVVIPGISDNSFTGEVLRIDKQVTMTGAGPFITVYGVFANEDGRLVTGMMGRAKIFKETTSLLHQFKNEFTSVIRQEIWPR
jgi:hypothetical protein